MSKPAPVAPDVAHELAAYRAGLERMWAAQLAAKLARDDAGAAAEEVAALRRYALAAGCTVEQIEAQA